MTTTDSRPKGETISALVAEVQRARAKFPANDHLLAALMEEVGELAKAMLENEPLDAQCKEALQVACVALRIAEEGDGDYKDEARDARLVRGLAFATDPMVAAMHFALRCGCYADGLFVRLQVDGKWQSVALADLDPAVQAAVVARWWSEGRSPPGEVGQDPSDPEKTDG